MKQVVPLSVLVVALVFSGAGVLRAKSAPNEAARDLVQRIVPSADFVVETIPAENGKDVFEIESRGDKIVLRGNNGVAIASALNWYLKYYCHCYYALKDQQMNLPSPLPKVETKVRNVSQYRWRYFLNYCCFGYSLPWYNWGDWQRLIDWMALNGVNAPLSVTGEEAVWAKVGRRLGFSDQEMSQFLAGPPFLPFGWMGCLDGWGGPLPQSWIARHQALEKQILARERSLGMTPVLQGFTGHVPAATAVHFPGAHLRTIDWVEWQTKLLDPLDPLFSRFAGAFMEEQRKLYGTDHLYAADTFIEMLPPSGETNFLAAMGEAIYAGMGRSDPKAIWVLQGWTFLNQAKFWTPPRMEAFLGAVSNQHMLVLDLWCDVKPAWSRTRAFCGKPWAWCALQNFGDKVFLGSALEKINQDLPAARQDPLAQNLCGLGFVNEGLGYDPVVFDFLFERAWSPGPVDLTSWLQSYAVRAYGSTNSEAAAAWAILKEAAFNTNLPNFNPAYTSFPSFRAGKAPPFHQAELLKAWEHLLRAAPASGGADAYSYDLVSVTRQALANYSTELRAQAAQAWKAKDREALQAVSGKMLGVIADVDELLATRQEYLLGNWVAAARAWGETPTEKDSLEGNARRVITLWGSTRRLQDYSRREWSGMFTGFYGPRWSKFFAAADAALAAHEEFDEAGFGRSLVAWEKAWANERVSYPTQPRGDSIEVSRRLWAKYGPELEKQATRD